MFPTLGLLLALAFGTPGWAQNPGRWTVYRATNGLPEDASAAVTLSPRGQVWVKQHPGKPIVALDGHGIRAISPAVASSSPVYESRSGQIWCLVQDGVMEYRRDQWIRHPVPEIRALAQVEGGRVHRSIPILPGERDHVVILLPDRLIEFDARHGNSLLLRSAAETGLGRFLDFTEGRDGVIWLLAEAGLARLPGPIRRLGADTHWDEFPLSPGQEVILKGRAFEDEEGGVTAVGWTRSGTNRCVVHFDGKSWGPPLPAPDDTRFAWRVPDESFWAATPTGLFCHWNGAWVSVPIPGWAEGTVHDVAVDYNGVFWLATSVGLMRRAGLTWNLPAGSPPELATPCRALAEDRANSVWFACEGGLVRQTELKEWRTYAWPAGWPTGPEPPTRLLPLEDGRVLVGQGERLTVFAASGEKPAGLPGPGAALVGTVAPGVACLSTAPAAAGERKGYVLWDGDSVRPFPPEALARWPEPNLEWTASDLDGTLWMVGRTNLALWRERQQRLQILSAGALESPMSLLNHGRGRSWFARGGSIAEYNDRSWTLVRVGLGRVNAMREARDGGVWVATSEALYRFLDGSWVENGDEDGLVGGGVADVLQTRGGELWAATDGGARRYRREADLDPPRAEIQGDEGAREVTVNRVSELPIAGEDRWRYTPSNRLVYSWRLDDGRWSAFGRLASVTVSNPPPGRHQVTVRAMDRNWNVQGESAAFELEAVVPWYHEPRIVVVAAGGVLVALMLGWLAVNRHLSLRRSYAEVGRIVAQRTRELEQANAELLHSQKMRALGTLAAGIAHDFNNILSIIKGSAQIIEANPDDPEKIRTRLSRIRTMVEQGSGIVRSMLGFVRPRAGDEHPLAVNSLVQETLRLVGEHSPPGVHFRFDPDPAIPQPSGRADLVRQILMNLLFNAVDATNGKGEVRLRTAVAERPPEGLVLPPASARRHVSIEVSDSGHGIDPEVLPRIFEPFFTTKALSTRRGTGLGLTMVYEIAKDNGYGLAVESIPGEGATFRLYLPVPDAEPAA